jgi:hypothetical protein
MGLARALHSVPGELIDQGLWPVPTLPWSSCFGVRQFYRAAQVVRRHSPMRLTVDTSRA